MSGFDWIIAVIFLLSILVGILRGFIREALSIASWVMAIWLSVTFCAQAGDFIGQYISIPMAAFRVSVGFAVVFIGTLFLFSIISYIVSKLLVKKAVKGTDRVLGVLFGAMRAAAIVVLLVLGARGLDMDNSDWWNKSNYLGYFVPIANYVEQYLPKSFQSIEQTDQTAEQGEISPIQDTENRLQNLSPSTLGQ